MSPSPQPLPNQPNSNSPRVVLFPLSVGYSEVYYKVKWNISRVSLPHRVTSLSRVELQNWLIVIYSCIWAFVLQHVKVHPHKARRELYQGSHKHSNVVKRTHKRPQALQDRWDHKMMVLQPVLIEQDQVYNCTNQTQPSA